MEPEQKIETSEIKAKKAKQYGNIFMIVSVVILLIGFSVFRNYASQSWIGISIIVLGFVSFFVGIAFQSSKDLQTQVEQKNIEGGYNDEDKIIKRVASSGLYSIIFGSLLVIFVLVAGFKIGFSGGAAVVFVLALGYIILGILIRKNPLNAKMYLHILVWPSIVFGFLLILKSSLPGIIFLLFVGDLANSLNKLRQIKKSKKVK